MTLTAANVNKGLSLNDNITDITDWSLQFQNRAHSKDIQKAVNTGNFSQLEREMTAMYNKLQRSYNPAKIKGFGKIDAVRSLSIPELEKAQELAVSITGTIKRKHRHVKMGNVNKETYK